MLGKPRSQDNPVNPLENNRIKKTKVFKLRYEQKLYLVLLSKSNGMKIDPLCNQIKGIKWD